MSRGEMEPLPQPPTAEEKVRHQGLKMSTLMDAKELLDRENDPDRHGKALARLAVAGLPVPAYLWESPPSWQDAFVIGAYEGGRFITRLQRSGGIA